jgi:hypothetical protein
MQRMQDSLLRLSLSLTLIGALAGCGGGSDIADVAESVPAQTAPEDSGLNQDGSTPGDRDDGRTSPEQFVAQVGAEDGALVKALAQIDPTMGTVLSLNPSTSVAAGTTTVTLPPNAGEPGWYVAWPKQMALRVLPANNRYNQSGNSQVLYWPLTQAESTFINDTNCGGFVTRSLKRARSWTDDQFRAWFGGIGPNSAEYHDKILGLQLPGATDHSSPFTRITRVTDIRSGDVLAAKYMDATSGGSGHMMFAAGTPRLSTMQKAPWPSGSPANSTQYELLVIDSTGSPHGDKFEHDSRVKMINGVKTQTTGAGYGYIRIFASSDGTIAGYTWSWKNPTFYSTTLPAGDRRSLVVGRIS